MLLLLGSFVRGTARAQVGPAEIMAAVKVIEFGMSIAQMHRGAGTDNSAAMQLNLLNFISDKLDAIQEGIDKLLEEVKAVGKLVEQTPEKVVNEGATRNLKSALRQFQQQTEAIGVNAPAEHHLKALEGVLAQISKERNLLFEVKSVVTLPLLSTALYAELGTLRILSRPEGDIRAALKPYREFFVAALFKSEDCLEKQIAAIRGKRQKLVREVNPMELFRGKIKSDSSVRGQMAVGSMSYILETDDSQLREQCDELVELGLISNSERCVRLKKTFAGIVVKADTLQYKFIKRDTTEYEGVGNYSALNAFSEEADLVDKAAQQKVNEINLETIRLCTYSACYHSAVRALNVCQWYEV